MIALRNIILAAFIAFSTAAKATDEDPFVRGAEAATLSWFVMNCARDKQQKKTEPQEDDSTDFIEGWRAASREIGLRQKEVGPQKVCIELALLGYGQQKRP